MRKVRIWSILAGILLSATFALQSCDLDDDDDNYHAYYPNALVTVFDQNGHPLMQLDDSTTLYPVNLTSTLYGGKSVRALINFRDATEAELKDGIYADEGLKNVYVNRIDTILTKSMSKDLGTLEANRKAYGNDPVEIVNDWVTLAEDGYLTLRFRTLWGGSAKHIIRLVKASDVNTPNAVRLYQDAQGDVNGRYGDALVAFKLDNLDLKPKDKKVTITLLWNSFDGEKSTTFTMASQDNHARTSSYISSWDTFIKDIK